MKPSPSCSAIEPAVRELINPLGARSRRERLRVESVVRFVYVVIVDLDQSMQVSRLTPP